MPDEESGAKLAIGVIEQLEASGEYSDFSDRMGEILQRLFDCEHEEPVPLMDGGAYCRECGAVQVPSQEWVRPLGFRRFEEDLLALFTESLRGKAGVQ
jgi:hypothetical protein